MRIGCVAEKTAELKCGEGGGPETEVPLAVVSRIN